MDIGFNKYQLYGKIVVLAIVLSIIGVVLYFHPSKGFDDQPTAFQIIFSIFLGASLLFMFVLMILQLLLLPAGVNIDYTRKTLTIKFPFAKTIFIAPTDIMEYRPVSIKTKSTPYGGVNICLNNGREYLLSDFNLNDSAPIQSFLEESQVPVDINKKFSFITYFINNFKIR
jgi:hypothetical protein